MNKYNVRVALFPILTKVSRLYKIFFPSPQPWASPRTQVSWLSSHSTPKLSFSSQALSVCLASFSISTGTALIKPG